MLYRICSIYDADVRSNRSGSRLPKDAFNQAMAAEVRSLLAKHRRNQADAARHLGMKPNAASFRWNGKTPWSLDELIELCDWLNEDAAVVMARAKATAIAQDGTAKQALESMLTEQERAEIEEQRQRLRPADEDPGEGENPSHREAR